MGKHIKDLRLRSRMTVSNYAFHITHADKVMLLGSCFTDHFYTYLTRHKFSCLRNPYGTSFNPVSIASQIIQICNNKQFTEKDLILDEDIYFHYDFHSAFTSTKPEQSIKLINQAITGAHSFLKKANYLLITLGTAWVHQHIDKNKIVNNCHKQPATTFEKYRLSVKEIISSISQSLDLLFTINPGIQTILTVSPVRHLKDGIAENSLSKSSLRLSADYLCQVYPNCHYFPSFEIMMDDLRDYRFYEEDLVHPNKLATAYIEAYFQESLLSKETQEINSRISKLQLSLAHKPFHHQSAAHQKFLKSLQIELDQLRLKYPNFNFTEEEEKLQFQLSRANLD